MPQQGEVPDSYYQTYSTNIHLICSFKYNTFLENEVGKNYCIKRGVG